MTSALLFSISLGTTFTANVVSANAKTAWHQGTPKKLQRTWYAQGTFDKTFEAITFKPTYFRDQIIPIGTAQYATKAHYRYIGKGIYKVVGTRKALGHTFKTWEYVRYYSSRKVAMANDYPTKASDWSFYSNSKKTAPKENL